MNQEQKIYQPWRLIVGFVLVLALSACTAGNPEIIAVDLALEYRFDTLDNRTILSPFILLTASDPDGSADLQAVELYQSPEDRFWFADRNMFQLAESKGQALILIRNLIEDSGQYQGKVTVKLIDKAGNEASRVFSLDYQNPPAKSDRDIPRIEQLATGLKVSGPGAIIIRGLDYEGKVHVSKELQGGSYSFEELGIKDPGSTYLQYFAQHWSEKERIFYISGPW